MCMSQACRKLSHCGSLDSVCASRTHAITSYHKFLLAIALDINKLLAAQPYTIYLGVLTAKQHHQIDADLDQNAPRVVHRVVVAGRRRGCVVADIAGRFGAACGARVGHDMAAQRCLFARYCVHWGRRGVGRRGKVV